jgi:hypothetical protein
MIKKALSIAGMAYLGMSLTACAPERHHQQIYGNERAALNTPIKMYEIQEGDTFNEIAKINGVTATELHEVNPNLEDRSHIEVGAILYIPLEKIVTLEGTPSRKRPISW